MFHGIQKLHLPSLYASNKKEKKKQTQQEGCNKNAIETSYSLICLLWAILPGRQSTSANILIVWLHLSLKKREGSSCQNPIASSPFCWAGHVAMVNATSAVKPHWFQNHVVNASSTAVVRFCSLDWQEEHSSLMQLSGYSLLIARVIKWKGGVITA